MSFDPQISGLEATQHNQISRSLSLWEYALQCIRGREEFPMKTTLKPVLAAMMAACSAFSISVLFISTGSISADVGTFTITPGNNSESSSGSSVSTQPGGSTSGKRIGSNALPPHLNSTSLTPPVTCSCREVVNTQDTSVYNFNSTNCKCPHQAAGSVGSDIPFKKPAKPSVPERLP